MIFEIIVILLLVVIVFQLAEVLYRLPRRDIVKEAMKRDGLLPKKPEGASKDE